MPHPASVFRTLLPSGNIPTLLAGKNILPGRWARVGVLGALLVCSTPLALAAAARGRPQAHTFTDTNGKTYDAQVLAIRSGEVNVRRSNGKVYSVDINTLSKPDRDYLDIWQNGFNLAKDTAANSDSAIDIKVVVESSANSKDSTVLVTPRVSLLNQESSQNFKGVKGTLILLGQQNGETDKFTVLRVEKFTGNLTAQKKFSFTGKPQAPTLPGAAAYVYKGYVFVLQNAAADIIQFQHSDIFLNNAADALKLRNGDLLVKPSATSPEQIIHLVRSTETWGPIPPDAQPAPPGHT